LFKFTCRVLFKYIERNVSLEDFMTAKASHEFQFKIKILSKNGYFSALSFVISIIQLEPKITTQT